MSKAWWDRNWDKVIVAITTTVIAGIIAYYSTIIDVKDEIAEINSRLIRVEGCIEDLLKPATTIAYKNKAKIIGLEKEIENSSESQLKPNNIHSKLCSIEKKLNEALAQNK